MTWWRSLLHRSRESEFDSELLFHIDRLTEEKIAAGVPALDARRQALVEFGGKESLKEDLRDVHRPQILSITASNLRSAIRSLRKAPSFSLTIIATLALGIGANTAVFSAIDAILLRPLPFPEGDELMQLSQRNPTAKASETPVAPPRLEDWNRMNHTFQGLTGYYTQDVSETSGALPEEITQAMVTARFFQVWGIAPELGRVFAPEEERMGGASVAAISDRLWRRRFGADPAVIGKRLRVGSAAYTIVAVMPASFRFPAHETDFWTPVPVDAPVAQVRSATWYTVIGRLKPGVPLAQARADLQTVQSLLGKQYPATDAALEVLIQPLKEITVGGVRSSLWVLFGSVTVLLLIACVNIAALLLARTSGRQREISIRYSLGASRSSLVMQLMLEVFVLAVAGSALAIFVAQACSEAFRKMAADLPRIDEIALDGRLLAYTGACAIATALLCGLLPAIRGTSRNIAGTLARNARSQVRGTNRLQWVLVSVQVALAATLLVGSGLLLRSFQALGRVSAGFDPKGVLTLRISANWAETADQKGLHQRMERDLDALRAVPGVEGAASSLAFPGVALGPGPGGEFRILEGSDDASRKIIAYGRLVSDGYFALMRIPLLAGEDCRRAETGSALVNRSFAEAYLGGRTAIGAHLEQIPANPYLGQIKIVGMVADAREQGLQRAPAPVVYYCDNAPQPSPAILIRTLGDPMAMAETLRRKMREVEPARSLYQIAPLEQHLDDTLAESRLRTELLTFFALTAVLLACIGVYGTLSYVASLRRREVGLRLAIGAVPRNIAFAFLGQGVRASLIGCAGGLLLAAGVSRFLAGMLYGVTSLDAPTFGGVALLMLLTAAISSWGPAARAARVDPMQVLRDE